jgi:hypothetical protein
MPAAARISDDKKTEIEPSKRNNTSGKKSGPLSLLNRFCQLIPLEARKYIHERKVAKISTSKRVNGIGEAHQAKLLQRTIYVGSKTMVKKTRVSTNLIFGS